MENVYVHPRVHSRHPELDDADVLSAWRNAIEVVLRQGESGTLYVAVGSDPKGRLIEMVAVFDGASYLIYHAMTPPSNKTLRELRLQGR